MALVQGRAERSCFLITVKRINRDLGFSAMVLRYPEIRWKSISHYREEHKSRIPCEWNDKKA